MTGIVCHRFLVAGKVQGVFFRASAARQATRLGIRGWARNLPDGRVEVLAQGKPASIAELRDWLSAGPPQARVDDVSEHVEDLDAVGRCDDFRTG